MFVKTVKLLLNNSVTPKNGFLVHTDVPFHNDKKNSRKKCEECSYGLSLIYMCIATVVYVKFYAQNALSTKPALLIYIVSIFDTKTGPKMTRTSDLMVIFHMLKLLSK